jgi:hypothetical protein
VLDNNAFKAQHQAFYMNVTRKSASVRGNQENLLPSSGIPRTFFLGGGDYARNFFQGGSTSSVEDRQQIKQGSGGGSPLVRGSAQFANE